MDWITDYKSKFKSAEEAVSVVKDGDTVAYSEFAMASMYLDAAFAGRVPGLHGITLRSTTCPFPPKAVLADPKRQHLRYNDWHFSPASRKLCDKGLRRRMTRAMSASAPRPPSPRPICSFQIM